MKRNKLNVEVTRPLQEVVIMRGIPGSGKSTKAKEIVGDGIIHSTDDLIEASGSYRDFFETMIREKDFKPLSRMHSQNLKNVKASILKGISPVVVDNTNIKQNEAKGYVKVALEAGIDNDMIKFIDVGTGGLDAKGLAERNTHGVPFDKIETMIASHKGQGVMTLESVLKSKDMYKENDVLYTCVLLDDFQSRVLLNRDYPIEIPDGWTKFGHHVTINLGPAKDKSRLGEEVLLSVVGVGISDMAMAVKVTGIETKNEIAHVTLAINPDGGKPVMSNDITKWQDIKMFIVCGVITEIKKTR